MMSRFKDAG